MANVLLITSACTTGEGTELESKYVGLRAVRGRVADEGGVGKYRAVGVVLGQEWKDEPSDGDAAQGNGMPSARSL
jgi:hypothetical protein